MHKMLSQFGIEPERLKLEWVSAAEAQKFARAILEFTNELRKLGPLRNRDKITVAVLEETALTNN